MIDGGGGIVPRYIRPQEAEAILDWLRQHRRCGYWYLVFRLCWETGARISEAIALQADHIGDDHVYLITLKRRGGRHPLRQVFCSPELCQLLREQAAGREGLVFTSRRGGRANRATGWRWFKRAAAACKVALPKGDTLTPAWPHSMRHGRAMAIIGSSGSMAIPSIQAQFGHASARGTLQYLRPSPEDVRRAVLRSLGKLLPGETAAADQGQPDDGAGGHGPG